MRRPILQLAERGLSVVGILALGFLIPGIASAAGVQPDPVDPVLEARFRAMPAQDDVVSADDWYRPTMVVRGASRHGAARAAATSTVPTLTTPYAAALAGAQAWDTLALVVLRDGRVELEYYAPGITPSTRFDTQSMHRGLLTLAVLAAVEDGHLASLDAPVSRWIPEWRGEADPRAAITIRDLLLGQSGLADPPFESRPDSPGMQLFIGTDLRGLVTAQQAQAPRATRWRGNALDSQALGLALEAATGEPYARYLSRRLWKPVGATDALVQLDRDKGSTRTFCCLKSTARDWARIGELVRRGGAVGGRQVLAAQSVAEVLTPSPLNRSSGMNWLLEPVALVPRSLRGAPPPVLTAFAEPGVAYIGGRGGQRVYVVPSQRAVVVRIGRIRNDFDDGRFLNPFIDAMRSLP
jgi:CubicO group peptidase (beta-lactamase class C family)